jgi:hypothetical protein
MNDLERELNEKAEAEQRIVDEVMAEMQAGKLDANDAFDVIDARLIAAGLKKKSDPPWGTIVYDREAAS